LISSTCTSSISTPVKRSGDREGVLLPGVLVAHGFRPPEALAIYRATVSYARGYALAEATGFTVDAARPSGRTRLATLPGREFPILRGKARELAELDADTGFELGLYAPLTGLTSPWIPTPES
jgi:hypothetical protein